VSRRSLSRCPPDLSFEVIFGFRLKIAKLFDVLVRHQRREKRIESVLAIYRLTPDLWNEIEAT
jgi:hypothetical protein